MKLFVADFDCEIHYARASTKGPHPSFTKAQWKRLMPVAQTISEHLGEGWLVWLPTEDKWQACVGNVVAQAQPPTVSLEQACWSTRKFIPSICQKIANDSNLLAELNDRRFYFENFGEAHLPQHCQVQSAEALWTWLQKHPATNRWVVRAPYGASGREKLFFEASALSQEYKTRIERLLIRYGVLYVEPWKNRIHDFSIQGNVDVTVSLSFFREQQCTRFGMFRGFLPHTELSFEYRERCTSIANQVGETLLRKGYRGPFSCDSFVYREEDQTKLHSLCEINVRHTMGTFAPPIERLL